MYNNSNSPLIVSGRKRSFKFGRCAMFVAVSVMLFVLATVGLVVATATAMGTQPKKWRLFSLLTALSLGLVVGGVSLFFAESPGILTEERVRELAKEAAAEVVLGRDGIRFLRVVKEVEIEGEGFLLIIRDSQGRLRQTLNSEKWGGEKFPVLNRSGFVPIN